MGGGGGGGEGFSMSYLHLIVSYPGFLFKGSEWSLITRSSQVLIQFWHQCLFILKFTNLMKALKFLFYILSHQFHTNKSS